MQLDHHLARMNTTIPPVQSAPGTETALPAVGPGRATPPAGQGPDLEGPTVLAIDPGNTHSAYALIGPDRRPLEFGKVDNRDLRTALRYGNLAAEADRVVIEMVASYGMPVGADVFDTCVWIGRFAEAIHVRLGTTEPDLVFRKPVKLHHCHDSRAKDSNITQALVDRFAPGQPNRGKGTKNAPGWFYGFKADVWQAYALAVYVADTQAPSW